MVLFLAHQPVELKAVEPVSIIISSSICRDLAIERLTEAPQTIFDAALFAVLSSVLALRVRLRTTMIRMNGRDCKSKCNAFAFCKLGRGSHRHRPKRWHRGLALSSRPVAVAAAEKPCCCVRCVLR